jgi:hypothetical protein
MSLFGANRLWDTLIEGDIDTLVQGLDPLNDDLAPLTSFVASLRSLASTSPPEEVMRTHVELAAGISREMHVSAETYISPARRLVLGARRRMATVAASLVMLMGATGVAWAADSAVPGDWNYGIDRALEALGMGAGEEVERMAEARVMGHRAIEANPALSSVPDQAEVDGAPGLVTAVDALSRPNPGGSRAQEVRTQVASLLGYLHRVGRAHGPTVAEMAKKIADSEPGPTAVSGADESNPGGVGDDQTPGPDQGKPDTPGQPDDRGKSGDRGNP